MKTNIRNRPKLGNYPEVASKKELRKYTKEITDWFSNFEDELREEIKRLKDAVDTAKNPYEAACFLATAQKLEEVLGE